MEAMWERWGPLLVMLMVSLAFGIGNCLVEEALRGGLDGLVLVTVRQLIAAIFLGPIAYFKERKKRPKLTWRVSMYMLINALIGGSLAQYLFYIGMQNTSATFACAFLNLLPVLTFLLAVSFRHEKLNLKNIVGKAKVLASAICVVGVVVLICYRGAPLIHTGSTPVRGTTHDYSSAGDGGSVKRASRWIFGSTLLLACCLCWTAWFLIQSKISKNYPTIYSSNSLMFFVGFFLAAALTVATHRGVVPLSTLKGRIAVAAVVYSGIVSSAFGFLAMTWCVAKRGPVFPSVFTPLVQMFVGIIDISLLKEPLFVGSLLGSVLVILGLYILLWAKTKEAERVEVKPVQEVTKEVESGEDHSKLPV